jgi:hypothetical protein
MNRPPMPSTAGRMRQQVQPHLPYATTDIRFASRIAMKCLPTNQDEPTSRSRHIQSLVFCRSSDQRSDAMKVGRLSSQDDVLQLSTMQAVARRLTKERPVWTLSANGSRPVRCSMVLRLLTLTVIVLLWSVRFSQSMRTWWHRVWTALTRKKSKVSA